MRNKAGPIRYLVKPQTSTVFNSIESSVHGHTETTKSNMGACVYAGES